MPASALENFELEQAARVCEGHGYPHAASVLAAQVDWPDSYDDDALKAEAQRLVVQGKPAHAIALYRRYTGATLAEARTTLGL